MGMNLKDIEPTHTRASKKALNKKTASQEKYSIGKGETPNQNQSLLR